MLNKDPILSYVITWFFISAISVWGGIVKYILNSRKSQLTWNLSKITKQLIISGFTGILGGLIVYEYGGSDYFACIVAGVFGATGKNVLIYFQKRFFP